MRLFHEQVHLFNQFWDVLYVLKLLSLWNQDAVEQVAVMILSLVMHAHKNLQSRCEEPGIKWLF